MALREFSFGTDTPTTPTSSVGEVVFPPVAASEKRKKGIFPSVIAMPSDLLNITSEFSNLPLDDETSRISVRYFVENNVLMNLTPQERMELTPSLEGIVRLAGDGTVFNDCSIIYLGKNADNRRTQLDVFSAELQMAQEIFSKPPMKQEHNYSGFTFREITPEDKIDSAIIDQYTELYKAFGWTRAEVIKILQNPTNILLGGFVENQLVSAGMAERAQFNIERGGIPQPFVMYEITEAATKSDYRGKGLYTQVAEKLMRLLSRTDIDLLYGESNLLSEPVIQAAHSLGRTSSIETMLEFGFPPRFLEQHVRISGGANDTRPPGEKNDLLPTYMTRNKLLQYSNEQ